MLLEEATNFIQTMYGELNYSNHTISKRITEIEKEINWTGTYTHTYEELNYGAKWHGVIPIDVSGAYFGNH